MVSDVVVAEPRRRGWIIVIVVIVLLFTLPLFVVGTLGFLDLPVFNVFYRPPTPTRVVTVSKETSVQDLQQLVQERLEHAMRSGKPPYRVTVSEEEMTAGFRSALAPAFRDPRLHMEQAQVVFLPQAVELSGSFTMRVFRLDVRVRANLSRDAARHTLRLEPTEIRLGALSYDRATAEKLLAFFFNRGLGTWEWRTEGESLQDLTVTDRALTATFTNAP
jgi:hypothetical protein